MNAKIVAGGLRQIETVGSSIGRGMGKRAYRVAFVGRRATAENVADIALTGAPGS